MEEVHASIRLDKWPYSVPTEILQGTLGEEYGDQSRAFSVMAMPTGQLLLIVREEMYVRNLVSEPLVFNVGDTMHIQCKVIEGSEIGVFFPYYQVPMVDGKILNERPSGQMYNDLFEIRDDVVNYITLKKFINFAFPNRGAFSLKELAADMISDNISMSDLVDAYHKFGYFLPEIDRIWSLRQYNYSKDASEDAPLISATNAILMMLTLSGKYHATAYGTYTNFGRHAYFEIGEAKKRLGIV